MTYKKFFKRFFDIALASVIFLCCVPILFLSILGIRLVSPGPIFFRQRRVGRHGKVFEIFKLRTMSLDPNRKASQTTLADPEVFAFGRVLRRLKIDELPQVMNVLRGDMSIVGPRPCLEHTFTDMPDWAKRRLEVRPGITGQAQVNGNIAMSWEKRWHYDIQYVDNVSIGTDTKIILKTIVVVLLGEEKFRSVG